MQDSEGNEMGVTGSSVGGVANTPTACELCKGIFQ